MLRVPLIVAGVVVFLAISALLARWLSTENVERSTIERALRAEAAGRPGKVIAEIDGCARRPACVATARANATRLRRRGPLLVVAYESATAHALTSRTGPTRVVWKTPTTLTVVQCALVRRSGNVLTGLSVTLLRLSPPIRRTGAC